MMTEEQEIFRRHNWTDDDWIRKVNELEKQITEFKSETICWANLIEYDHRKLADYIH